MYVTRSLVSQPSRLCQDMKPFGVPVLTAGSAWISAGVWVCVCVQEVHPEVQAVASGAIASDYQRLRVESVRMPTSLDIIAAAAL